MGGGSGPGRGITLVVSTSKEHDPASENMADALMERAAWTPVLPSERSAFQCSETILHSWETGSPSRGVDHWHENLPGDWSMSESFSVSSYSS